VNPSRNTGVYGFQEINDSAFAPLREMGLLMQAAVLAKAQRREGHEGETGQWNSISIRQWL